MADSNTAAELIQMADTMIAYVGKKDTDRAKTMLGFCDRLYAIAGELNQPAAGTHAYEVVAAAETAHVETTETLIHMVAATALAAVLDNGAGGCFADAAGGWSLTFSPADMDRMHRDYEMSATRNGMDTTIRLVPRHEKLPSLAAEPGIDDTPADPQAAPHVYDRPYWAVLSVNNLSDEPVRFFACSDRHAAEEVQREEAEMDDGSRIAAVENRYCLHPDCPAKHCNVDNVPARDTSEK